MFEVVIVSSLFKDKRTLARHRLVNDTLKDEISKVHAFSQVCSTLTVS
jgi:stress-induced morphogen